METMWRGRARVSSEEFLLAASRRLCSSRSFHSAPSDHSRTLLFSQFSTMAEFRKKTRAFLRDTFGRTSRSVSRTHSPGPMPPDPSPLPVALASTSFGYASPPKSTSALATTGSVIHELLETARDGADLCLPLKAALVGVVKIWDVCEVRCATPICA